MPPDGTEISFDPVTLAARGQKVLGSKMGSARIRIDIPYLVDLYRQGRLKLDELISGRYPARGGQRRHRRRHQGRRAAQRDRLPVKIAGLKTWIVGNPPPGFGGRYFIFLKLVTDNGIEGVGEVYAATFDPKVDACR